MARFIKEHAFQGRKGHIYVDEYATKWEVVAKGYCAEFPCAVRKFKKSDCKTADDAAQRVADELNW